MTARGDERTHPSSPSPATVDRAAEPESRQVIDTAARVAEVKSSAVQEARELISRSLQDEREGFSSALNHSARLTTSVDVLAGTVAEMTSSLRTQLEDVTEALRALRGVGGEPAEEMGSAPPEHAPLAAAPDPGVEPSPQLTEMFREHITRMRDDGKPREEAERALLRFKLGHRFVEMLDDVYSSDAARTDAGSHS